MLTVLPEVADALAAGRPVVALESTIISHGLPRPDNLRVAREIEQAVRTRRRRPGDHRRGRRARPASGWTTTRWTRSPPATTSSRSAPATWRPSPPAGGSGATTVAATSHLAARAGIRVFATGGLGGVHRDARSTWDESADLQALATTPVAVVCAGVKSILDVPATLERLETLGVAVLGFGTDAFPGFYLTDSGHPVDWRVDTAEEVAAVMLRRATGSAPPDRGTGRRQPVARRRAGRPGPARPAAARRGWPLRRAAGVTGKDVTPFLLDWFHRESEGVS